MARPEDSTARARILEAAGSLFYERGVSVVGISEIVAAAGTGKNVLYRHFPGKDELVLAYLQDVAERMDVSMSACVTGLSPPAALVALAQHVGQLVSTPDYWGCPMRNYLRETRDINGPAGRFALARVRGLHDRIEQLTAGLDVEDPEKMAQRIWLVLEGVYATTLHPERSATALIGVQYVAELVGESARS